MAENNRPSWHVSLAEIVAVLVVGAIVTSPCWGYALILAASK